MILCLGCDGSGWRRRERDEPEWDTYLEMPVVEAAALPTMPTSPRREHDDDAYGWERAAISRDRHGSYADLRRQLEWLAAARPERYRLVRAVLVDAEPRRLEERGILELQLGVLTLALRMRTIRVPHWLMEREHANGRRQTIAALAHEGLGAGEIARRLGIPKKVVRRRLKDVKALESMHAGVPIRAT